MSGKLRRALDVNTVPLEGTHLIEASAGTGKTFTITSLFLRFLVERELPVESLLAVTFTNAATAELKERVSARIAQALSIFSGEMAPESDPVCAHLRGIVDPSRAKRLLEKAAADVDRAGIFTIHGFAAKTLQDHAFESGARTDAELVGDQRSIVLDVVTDFWTSEIATLPEAVFRQIGGTAFFRGLLKVGLVKAGAFEVPLVRARGSLEFEAERSALTARFETARAEFLDHGEELLALLLRSPALNRNKMRPASLESDFLDYRSYFERGDPFLGHPNTERFTRSKVDSSLKKGQKAPEHPLLITLETLLDQWRRVERAGDELADELRAKLCERIDAALGVEQAREKIQSFDGLLSDLCMALRNPETGRSLARQMRNAYRVALIDEFQDTDPVQYEIFERVYQGVGAGAALYLIGDPKQSIYAFRGADIQTYLQAAGHAAGGTWTLSTSYRASPSLVAAQNALFQGAREPFGMEGIVYDNVAPRPGAEDQLLNAEGVPLPGIQLLWSAGRESDALELLAHEVARFLAAGHSLQGRPVGPSDIAVLTRTNHQAQLVQAALRGLEIPAVMHGDRSVFEAPEALELRRVLLAMAEPGNRILCQTALSARMIGLSAEDLRGFDADVEALELWMGRLRQWGELFKARGVAHAMERLIFDVDLMARTLRERDGERRMTNLRHLLELLHEVETVQHLGVAGLLRWFEAAIADPSGHAMAAEARQLRLESDADAVTLTTAHKSKGLEYNVVFLPTVGLPDAFFSDEAYRYFDEAEGKCLLEIRGKNTREESQDVHRREAAQESLRLGYVALTRAKHHVVALAFDSKKFSSLGHWLYERELPSEVGIENQDAYLKKLAADRKLSLLLELRDRSAGRCAVEEIDEAPGPPFSRTGTPVVLRAPPEPPKLIERERNSSFSAMVRGSSVSRAAREGRDIDEGTELAGGENPHPGVAHPSDVNPGDVDPSDADARHDERMNQVSVLAGFPRGARPGDALHAVFEHCPFEASAEQQRVLIARELDKRGFGPQDIEAATASFFDVLSRPLPGAEGAAELRLSDLGPTQRVPEMEFNLPVGLGSVETSRRLTSEALARALGLELSAHEPVTIENIGRRETELSPRYLLSLARLQFDAWSGFLRGFIDLVYEWDGRIYALDYKSNHLGDRYRDYGNSALEQAMEEHHYLLQALFYCVALHRYAKTRIVDYDYERHFGGMNYLFLRGMHPESSGGVYWFRPSFSLIDSLSSLFQGSGEAREEPRP